MVNMEVFTTWLNSHDALVAWKEFAYQRTQDRTQADDDIINCSGDWSSWPTEKGGGSFWTRLHSKWREHYNAIRR